MLEKINITDISKLKITKVKPWKIYFEYDNTKYMLLEDSDEDAHMSLYKRNQLENGNHTVECINGAITTMKPNSMIKDISNKNPKHLVYANIDRNWFVLKLCELGFSSGYLCDRQSKFEEKRIELDEEIKRLYNKINELRNKQAELLNDKYNMRKVGSKTARGNKIKKDMAERVRGKHNGEWCKTYNNFYGEPDPVYGGKLVDLYNLPVGTSFYVANGDWYGEIGYDSHGDKGVVTQFGFIKLDKNYHSLYLSMIDNEYV